MISIVVAASDNNVIGHLNKLPWYLPRDLKNFAKLTTGHTVIMGRKTFDSILARLGHPLPNRKNIVITRQENFTVPDGVIVAKSWDEAVGNAGPGEVFICGGAEIYKMALPHTNRLYLTRVHFETDGEIMLPITDFSDWNIVHQENWEKDEKNPYEATYYIYDRRQ